MVNQIIASDYFQKGTAYAIAGDKQAATEAYNQTITLRPDKAAVIKGMEKDIEKEFDIFRQNLKKTTSEMPNKVQDMLKSGKSAYEIKIEVEKDVKQIMSAQDQIQKKLEQRSEMKNKNDKIESERRNKQDAEFQNRMRNIMKSGKSASETNAEINAETKKYNEQRTIEFDRKMKESEEFGEKLRNKMSK